MNLISSFVTCRSKTQSFNCLLRYIKYLFLLLLLACQVQAQASNVDSLRKAINFSKNDSVKVDLLHQLYLKEDSVEIAIKALELSQQIDYKKGMAQSFLDLGRSYYFAGKEDISLNYLRKSLKIAEEINAKPVLKNAYRYIGFIYRPHEPLKAKEYYVKSLNMAMETGDEIAASYALSAIGNIYEGIAGKSEALMQTALKYYLKSLSIREKSGSYSEIAASLNESSRMYVALNLFDKAAELRQKGFEIAEKNNDVENQVYFCNLIGNDFYGRLKDYEQGLKYQLRAYELGKSLINKEELMCDIAKSVAFCYSSLKNYHLSVDYFIESLKYTEEIKEKERNHDYNLALVKDEIEKELEKQKLLLKDAELQKEKAEAKNLTIIRNALIFVFIIVLVFALIVYRGYKQKLQSNIELDARNREIEIAYRTLEVSEMKLKQITETINDVFYLYNIIEKRYEYISPNCEVVLGLKPRYFYEGKSAKVIVFDEDLQMVKDANLKIDAGIAYDIEYRIVSNNEIRWIAEKSSPIFDLNGNLIKNSGICRDITKRKITEENLRQKSLDLEMAYESLAVSESNFKEIASTIVNVFYLYNIIEKKYEYVSPNCKEILGIPLQSLYDGISMKTIVVPEDMEIVINANVMIDAGIAYDIEYRIMVDGEERWIAEKSNPVYNSEGKLIKNSGICQDVTRRKINEAIFLKKNKDITDSIEYASTIQKAILVPESRITESFKEFFVITKPKEIVSGDFYFFKETKNGIYLAVADCTGHGVPAGFMSMIGQAFLNEIIDVNPMISPDLLLDQLRDMIITTLNQNLADSESREGMDISVLHFNKKLNSVDFAGAFNSLYLIRNSELIEYKADLFPVGLNFGRELTPFTNNKIALHKGDCLYISSDGYVSQFGGPKNKKYSRKLFQNFLVSIFDKPMKEQGVFLDKNFVDWIGKNEQVDDVCIIGVRV